MSSRTRPPWSKKLRRIIGRRLRSGSLTPEARANSATRCSLSIQRRPPPPADVWRTDRRPSWELEQFIGKCYRSGDLGPEDALDLFDELLPAARPSSIYALNQLLATVACAPVSSTVRDGPALAVSMFNRMARAGANMVAPTTVTYNILINCCCGAGCLNLGLASLGKIFKTGIRADAICAKDRTRDAMNIVLRRMRELGCSPSVFSYNTLLKRLCAEKKCQEAADLIHRMAEDADKCPPDAMSYSTAINGFSKEDDWVGAYILFRKMLHHGIPPNVAICNSIIDVLCKVGAVDMAKEVLQQMIDRHIMPNCTTYTSILQGYLSLGQWNEEAVRNLKKMSRDIVTCNILIDYLCKFGCCAEAREIFNSMIQSGEKPNVAAYRGLLHGYASEGNLVEMNNVKNLMVQNGIRPDRHVFNIQIRGYFLAGEVDEVMKLLDDMLLIGFKPDVVTFNTLLNIMRSMGMKMKPDCWYL